MIKQKNGLIAGGVVVVLACAWWGLGAYASGNGDKRTIALTLNPRNGVSIAELLSSANNQSKVFALLAPALEN